MCHRLRDVGEEVNVESGRARRNPFVVDSISYAASRRPCSVARIASAPDWSPVNASRPAHWTNWVVHDSLFVLSFAKTALTPAGAMAAPSRHPVIAYFLLKV